MDLPASGLLQFHRTSWTSHDGAPVDVASMAQTDDGFMWFATGGGLVRFDGVQFEHYAPAPGENLPTESIHSLLALPGNILLIGWVFGGATLLQHGHVKNFGEHEGYPSGTTYQFLRDRDGIVWAANSAGLVRLKGDRWERVGIESNFVGKRALSLFQDRDGTLGVFTDKSLVVLPAGAATFQDTTWTSTSHLPVVQSASGEYYFFDRTGLHALISLADHSQRDRILVSNPPDDRNDHSVITDQEGSLWFSSARGVGRVAHPELPNALAEYFDTNDPVIHTVTAVLCVDRNGSIWVATVGGVEQLRRSNFTQPVGLSQVQLPALLPDADGGLLFAGLDSDLRRLSPNGAVQKIESMFVTSAYRDPKGEEWYGSQPRGPATAELIHRTAERTFHIPLPLDVSPELDVQSITMDADGGLWISVIRRGIYKFKNNSWTQPSELPGAGKQSAIVLSADSLDSVWLGYPANRLARWNQGNVQIYSRSNGLDVGNVLAIYQHGSHIWVGGDHGLALFDAGRFRAIKARDETVFRGITGIVELSNGDLWIHGRSGAILVEAREVLRAITGPGSPISIRLFDEDDGLYGLPTDIRPLPSLVAAPDGRLWFATFRGVFALDPQHIITNESPPNVVLKELRAETRRYVPGGDIVLPAHSSSIEFDYTAPGLVMAQRARFRYRLYGVDREWQEAASRRQAFYTNLGPGSYRFQVTACNENEVWNEAGVSMDFVILPAWYQTMLFRMVCALGAAGVVVLIFRFRLIQMRRQLQERLRERLLERERIARELHDTLIQGFQGLVLLFGAVRQRMSSEDPTRAMLSSALTRANDVLAEGRDRVKGLRDSMGLQSDLGAALNEAAVDLSQVYPGSFALRVNGAPRALTPSVMTECYQIGREALTNAYAHASARHVNLELTFLEDEFRLSVTDDGRGIEARILEEGGVADHFGMRGMRERARKIRGRLSIRSGLGSGTDVRLNVPGDAAYGRNGARWWTVLFGRGRTEDHDE